MCFPIVIYVPIVVKKLTAKCAKIKAKDAEINYFPIHFITLRTL